MNTRKTAEGIAKAGAKPTSSYHHGNLERGLIDLATEVIAKQGVEHLTLRLLGEQLGVSRSALYRHFPDKQTLLVRVAEEGFGRFGDALDAARASKSGEDVFVRMGRAYFDFARQNPGHYRVMFDTTVLKKAHSAKLHAAAKRPLACLVDEVVKDTPGTGKDHATLIETRVSGLWSLLHGYSMLAINGHLAGTSSSVAKSMVASVLSLLQGQRSSS
jgi:AcrR family transcriptional regulator